MGFNSYAFIFFFLPFVWTLFYLIARTKGPSVLWLVGASIVFYAWNDPMLISIMGVSLLVNYAFALKMKPESTELPTPRKRFFLLGVTLNLALLSFFKLAASYGGHYQVAFESSLQVGFPLALSFLTFQQILFLSELKNGNTKNPRFLHYCLYMIFFPQLLAGPLVKPQHFFQQFSDEKIFKIRWDYIPAGLSLIALGLFKKVALADPIARFADSAFNAAQAGAVLTTGEAWSGALSFSFQIYFDLSGYADMAMGIALLFGLRLPWNFNSPYKADSLIEFWRRWHITLSQFARDFIYIPLGGSKNSFLVQVISLLSIMTLTGLWHGAGVTFIVWGFLHGVFLIMNHAWRRISPSKVSADQSIWLLWAKRFATFISLVLLWVVFRAENIDTALSMWKSMAGMQNDVAKGFNNIKIGEDRLWFLAVLVWLAPNSREWMVRFFSSIDPAHSSKADETISSAKYVWRCNEYWAAFLAMLFIVALLQLPESREFIYIQF
jgi:alginate O-acetyltransferase complex protein AlgI